MDARTLSDEKCKEVLDAEYERGLNDAWRAARWIMDLTSDDVKRHDVIGDCAPKYALTKYSADKAIELIKEYKEKQQAEKSCKTCRYDYEICTPKYIDLRCWQSKQTDDEVKEQEEDKKQNEQINKTCKNCKWEDYDMTEQPCIDCGLGIEVWEPKQDEKKCMNCGHMHPHYDTFRCNIMGTCIGREKWIPKREYEKQSKDKTIWYLCSKEQPPDPRVTYGLDFEDCEYFAVSKKYLITINDKVEIGKWTWQRNRGLRWQDYEERLYEIHPEAWMLLPEPYRKE